VNPWLLFDFLIIGWHPVSIDGLFPFDLTKQRLLGLNSGSADTPFPLNASLDDDIVEVAYVADPTSSTASSPYHSGILHFIRPVFRGRLLSHDGVKLVGEFGGGWIVRLLGFTAIVIVALMALGFVNPIVGGIGLRLWGLPLVFIAACVVTRINGADDMRLILNNLTFALRGDG
jgi:hypothetical protein